MALDMDSLAAYERLVSAAKAREEIKGYSESHHIIPKALGGDDSQENLVALTAREHFVAHMLLAKVHGGAMWFAAVRMKHHCSSSRSYEIAKRNYALWMASEGNPMKRPEIAAARSGEGHHMKRVDQRLRASTQQATNNSMRTDEARARSSISHKGKTHSEATRAKMSIAQSGRDRSYLHTAEIRQKRGAAISAGWARRAEGKRIKNEST